MCGVSHAYKYCLCGVLTSALRFARATSSDQLRAIEPLVPSSIEYSFGKVIPHICMSLPCTLCNCTLLYRLRIQLYPTHPL